MRACRAGLRIPRARLARFGNRFEFPVSHPGADLHFRPNDGDGTNHAPVLIPSDAVAALKSSLGTENAKEAGGVLPALPKLTRAGACAFGEAALRFRKPLPPNRQFTCGIVGSEGERSLGQAGALRRLAMADGAAQDLPRKIELLLRFAQTPAQLAH